jgi:hypothetical protein
MALLYERAGRLTAKNGGFRPGQGRWDMAAVTDGQDVVDDGLDSRDMAVVAPLSIALPRAAAEDTDGQHSAGGTLYRLPNSIDAETGVVRRVSTGFL